MSPEFWAIIGGAAFVGFGVTTAVNSARHAIVSAIVTRLGDVENRLHEIEVLVGRIPGVEDYEPPSLGEWSDQRQGNPDANMGNRRNWTR